MLNKLPTWLPSLPELMADLGLTAADVPKMAKALGVSERSVWRWKAGEAPKMALLSLWWLSRWGHSLWDCEMHNRTELALAMRDSLWREVRKLQDQARTQQRQLLGQVARPQRAANEPDDLTRPAEVLRARPPGGERLQRRRG